MFSGFQYKKNISWFFKYRCGNIAGSRDQKSESMCPLIACNVWGCWCPSNLELFHHEQLIWNYGCLHSLRFDLNCPDKDPKGSPKKTRWQGSIYPTRAVCQNDIFQSRVEVLSNGAIPFSNGLLTFLDNTNTLPKTAFRNSKRFGFYATLKYAKIALKRLSSAFRKTFLYLDFKTLSNQASRVKMSIIEASMTEKKAKNGSCLFSFSSSESVSPFFEHFNWLRIRTWSHFSWSSCVLVRRSAVRSFWCGIWPLLKGTLGHFSALQHF